jgi:hypothetical protein
VQRYPRGKRITKEEKRSSRNRSVEEGRKARNAERALLAAILAPPYTPNSGDDDSDDAGPSPRVARGFHPCRIYTKVKIRELLSK